MQESAIRFYQTGTWTVGNRLLDPTDRTVQSSQERHNALNSGHRACQGCGEALGARYAVDAAFAATNGQIIATNATGCLEVFSTPYPESAWQLPWFHSRASRLARRAANLFAFLPWAATAAPQTSVSDACRACLSVTTTCSTSALTMRLI